MRKARIFRFAMTLVCAFLFIFSSDTAFAGEKEDFEAAKQKNTLKNWELFLKKYPKGNFVKPARKEHDEVLFRSALKEEPQRLETLFGQAKTPAYADKIFALWEEATWEKAEKSGSTRDYWQYVLHFPGGKYIKEAKSKIDQLDWAGCKEGTDTGKCREYLSKHPRGKYAKNAKKKLADIEFQAVRKKDSIEAYRRFLKSYRNHTEARARLNQLLYIKAEKSGKAKDWKEYKNFLRGKGAIQKRAEAREKIAQIEFEEAKKQDTIAAYEKFLLTNPYHKEANIRAIHLRYQRAVQSGTLEDWLAFHDKGKFYRLRRFNRRRIRGSKNKATRDKDIETINQMRQNAKIEIERLLYEKILAEPTLKLADDYLKRFPKGLHKQQVLAKKEPLMFQWAKDKKTIQAYKKYLYQFPRGANAERIRTNLDPLVFARAKKKDRTNSYKDYLRQFPNGKFSEQARKRSEWLKANPAVVEMAHPKNVRISSGFRWEWTTQFHEKSGKIGYEVRASGYIYDSRRRRWGVKWRGAFSARSISRGPIKVPPGGSGKHKYWIRGRQFCNGYASFTWRGKDASGRRILKNRKGQSRTRELPQINKEKVTTILLPAMNPSEESSFNPLLSR